MNEEKNDFSLIHLLIPILIGVGIFILSNNIIWLFLCLPLLFFMPIILQIRQNKINLYTFFRYFLLLAFPVSIFLSFGEIARCSSDWFIWEVLAMVAISTILTSGKRIGLSLWSKVYYIAILLFVFVIMLSMGNGAECGATNAKIKATMGQMRSAAELSKIRTASYKGIGEDRDFNALMQGVHSAQEGANPDQCFIDDLFSKKERNKRVFGEMLISTDGSTWCYKAQLINDPILWCVDSNGYAGYVDEIGCSADNYSCKVGSND